MRIDLHAHTLCSDGTDTPEQLIAKAVAGGLDVVAITDHDTVAGWDQAASAAQRAGIRLVRGIEISTSNGDSGLHLLAYGPDPTHPDLLSILTRGADSRDGRVAAMIANLAEVGIYITESDVTRHAGTGISGRPHVADAMIEAGYVANRDEAFSEYLRRGKPGYADRWQADVVDAVRAVTAAGGVAVLAHPWGRSTGPYPPVNEERFAELAAAGLVGIEVDHQEHTPSARTALRSIAANLGLLVTGSSDHHGTGKVNHDLGCNTTSPDVLEQLEQLLARNA